MKRLIQKVVVVFRLGILNIARVVVYRLQLRFGFAELKKIAATAEGVGAIFGLSDSWPVPTARNTAWDGGGRLFGWKHMTLSGVEAPDWFRDYFTEGHLKSPDRGWWLIPDFEPGSVDIKRIWELSRWEWMIAFAQSCRHGDKVALDKLHGWCNSWFANNPPYQGPNWKCGQEASIRVMRLAVSAIILRQIGQAPGSLIGILQIHLERIYPTMGYAIAQQNNHGTSEAAALYIGGTWLRRLGSEAGEKYLTEGRKWLNERAKTLILKDGTFSQYSTNYHRLMLETYSLCEVWGRQLVDQPLDGASLSRLRQATLWLWSLCDELTGQVPNLGANDGAHLLPLTDADYRDFRPSCHLAFALFFEASPVQHDLSDQHIAWLAVNCGRDLTRSKSSFHWPDGGFLGLRMGHALALLSYPQFRFRPSQSDLLHLDLWINGVNILRDSGTYSYNTDPETYSYFSGVKAHNTVEFDGHDQMPRLGRFLFGAWPSARNLVFSSAENSATGEVCYQDYCGATHHRKIVLLADRLRVTDTLSGFKHSANLRWHLAQRGWVLSHGQCQSDLAIIELQTTASKSEIALVTLDESLFYQHKDSIPVLECRVSEPCQITTEIVFG